MSPRSAPRLAGVPDRAEGSRSTTVTPRDATALDIDRIVEIAAGLREDVSPSSRQHGYLVSDYGAETYRAALGDDQLLLVVEVDGEVAGFLYGYAAEASPDPAVREAANRSVAGSAFLIKQVGVLGAYAGQGLGSCLYRELEARVHPIPLVAAVITHPPNVPSLRFHEAKGFQIATRFEGDDGRQRLLLRKTLPTLLSDANDLIVAEQYKVAMLLYQHEDTLNWTKLNNFFYINAGLLAATGLAMQRSPAETLLDPINALLLLAIASAGLLAGIIFTLALLSGGHYLQARKQAVVEIEHRLLAHGGLPVVDWQLARGQTQQLWRSPTAQLLRIVPIIGGLAWLGVGIAAVVAR